MNADAQRSPRAAAPGRRRTGPRARLRHRRRAAHPQQRNVRPSGGHARVTERIGRLFVEENLRDREAATDGTARFFDAEIDDVRRRLVERETRLNATQAASGAPRPRAGEIPFERGLMFGLVVVGVRTRFP